MDLSTLAAALIEARAAKDGADAALKAANKEVAEAEAALFAAMVEAELPKITHGGFGFSLDTKPYFSIKPEWTDEFKEAMTKLGRGGIFKVSVNYQTLNATMRELVAGNEDERVPDAVSEFVEVYDKPSVLVRKATKKGA